MNRTLNLAWALAAAMLLVSGCGEDSPREHGEKYRKYLEAQQRANGFSGDIDDAVRKRIDAYQSAEESKRAQMDKELKR